VLNRNQWRNIVQVAKAAIGRQWYKREEDSGKPQEPQKRHSALR
jgi:hypothetical protein